MVHDNEWEMREDPAIIQILFQDTHSRGLSINYVITDRGGREADEHMSRSSDADADAEDDADTDEQMSR